MRIPKSGLAPFWWEGNPDEFNNAELFGQNLFDPGSAKAITIVEGECDAAAAWTLLGSRYPVVSVLGAGSALRDVKNNYEYLDSFPEIVINFDTDTAKVNPKTGEVRYPGQEAAKKVADLFKPGKCRVLSLRDGKDANDYIRKGASKAYVDEWWKAPPHMPDGLKSREGHVGGNHQPPKALSSPVSVQGLDKLTYGIRLSEFITVTAETGIGKTSILKEIEYALLENKELKEKGYGVGFLHLEEPNYDTALGLLSIHNNKPYHLPDTERTVDELRSAYDAVLNNDRVVIWDHFGSNTIEAVLDKVRHMHALGCKYIVLDHLSIVVSDQSGDERKQLDEISTKLKTLCMNLNIALIVVIHQNRQGQIRGTAGVEQLSNIVLKLYRDNTDPNPWRRNVTKIMVEKNRFCGRTGPACYLWYNEMTGRLEELTPEEVETYESGDNLRDDARAF
jgi:twinkle protein